MVLARERVRTSRIIMARCPSIGMTIPAPDDEKLYLWLDPAETGATVLHGAYPDDDAAVPCGPAQACEEVADVAQLTLSRDLRIQPNPARDVLHLRWARGQWSEAAMLRIRDAAGRILHEEPWWGGSASVSVADWPRGMVLLSVALPDGAQCTRRLILE